MSAPVRTCGIDGCERRSAMPAPYEARCARHELQDVARIVRDADRAFQARMAALRREKNL